MQDTANANQTAVGLAEQNIKATQEQFRRDQRAWVGDIDNTPPPFTDGIRKVFIKEGEGLPPISIIIMNSGKTPARKIKGKQIRNFFPANRPFTPDDVPPPRQSISVLQPGATARITYQPKDKPLDQEIINLLRNGDLIYYIYGEITYEDVFGKAHKTTYCKFIDKDLSSLINCNTYNDAN
jgi:hypothetical protein